MNTKQAVLARLEVNVGEFISGEDIAESLGVTRAAVWKAIRELTSEGISIDAVRNQGYRLMGTDANCMSRLLSADRIRAYLSQPDTIKRIDVHWMVDSTNKIARELANTEHNDTLIVAAAQTSGRGRLGRSFFSPEGSGLYMSLLLHPEREASDSVLITTAAAVAVSRAIDKLRTEFFDESVEPAQLKWVNDVYISGRKVCGILTEAQLDLETSRLEYAVLGIGLNVVEPEGGFPEEIKNRAGAIFAADIESDLCKTTIPNDVFNRLAAEVVNEFYKLYPTLDKGLFLDDYRSRSFLTGKRVEVIRGTDSYDAIVVGIDEEFRLIVKKIDNNYEEYLSSGEVSLRL
ncbi:MAG: biotin--[acetyl-CoA-carboxylase] ligase [Clostridiales bacterium]|nr:biotin--[acetyl-CoA-carboxylase] ligase [Clostridiales bacterium]